MCILQGQRGQALGHDQGQCRQRAKRGDPLPPHSGSMGCSRGQLGIGKVLLEGEPTATVQ